LKNRRLATVLVAAAIAAAALWAYRSRARSRARSHPASPETVAIQDGKTIDFSGGSPVVKDSAADKAALAAAVRDMDAAAKTVTFPATAQPAK
jgi:hypothetical protein